MRLLISAGEASGEHYGAQLIEAVRRLRPDAEFFGVGGERMRQAGCELTVQAQDVAVLGLAEVVTHLPRIYSEFQRLLRAAEARKPDAAVLIDFPDFNLRLARKLHQRGIPVVYYVSPQLWAWREGRVEQVRRHVRKMLVIFPFEERWYRQRGVRAEYVGHPLADAPPPEVSRAEFAQQQNLDAGKPWVALLPGSRRREFRMNLLPMLEAADRLGNGYEFILPVASTLTRGWVDWQLSRYCAGRPQQKWVFHSVLDARAALRHARAAVVASGTATVEAALAGTPFVVVYRVSPLTWLLGRPLVRVPHFAMANLIAGREVVPELVQRDFTAERVSQELGPLLSGGEKRERMVADLALVAEKLRSSPDACGTAAARAARAVLSAVAEPR